MNFFELQRIGNAVADLAQTTAPAFRCSRVVLDAANTALSLLLEEGFLVALLGVVE